MSEYVITLDLITDLTIEHVGDESNFIISWHSQWS